MKLENAGWSAEFAGQFEEYGRDGYSPGRISLEQKGLYSVITQIGDIPATLTGKMLYEADERQDLPVVGDWVAVRIQHEAEPWAKIHGILPRKSKFSRKEAGDNPKEQIIASNIDTVFIVTGLDHNFSVRRIERYLTLAWESGADPVVILTKADMCGDVEKKVAEVESAAVGVSVHAISIVDNLGLDALPLYLTEGKTVALLGSSGVGKSTILNHLLGKEIQRVQEVRELDSKGRHTTTHRQMFVLPSGALLIDTPGMKELQLWSADDGLAETFGDIEELATRCRFPDCTHGREPECAIREALSSGELDAGRFENYTKMQKELAHLARKQDVGSERAERMKWKKIHKDVDKIIKKKADGWRPSH